jgi:mitochondrial fission protein ELM1
LSPFLRYGLGWAYNPEGDPVTPPWPDLLIATGRASIPASLHVRRQSEKAGKRTFTVQLQNPVIDTSRFDLVVVPRHDAMTAANVMSTRGALHRISPEMLKREGEKFSLILDGQAHNSPPHLGGGDDSANVAVGNVVGGGLSLRESIYAAPPPNPPPKGGGFYRRPYIAVLIGGSNAVYQLTPREMEPVAKQLAELARTTGGSLIVTPSRRTGEANLSLLKEALKDVPSYIWDGTGTNPYYGMLALADYIVVTCDSVNMVSEACTTGKPTYVIDLPGGSDKFRRFHQSLRDDGLARKFMGKLESYSYVPLNDVRLVADKIREQSRLWE